MTSPTRARIKRIAIAKCDQFFIITMPNKSHLTIFVIQNLGQNTKNKTKQNKTKKLQKKHVNSIYIVGIMLL